MKSTKILALLLVAVMCFSMLASCNLNKPNGGQDNGDTPSGDTPLPAPHVHSYEDGLCNCGAQDPNWQPEPDEVVPHNYKKAEYNTTTSVMPSNWNEFTYVDNNDTQILSYISSSLFDYDYAFEGNKYNKDGSINVKGIISGAYSTNYSAATKLEDVTATVDAKWGYTDAQKKEGGYAWKITLRDDLKWDDGTPITAADFEYSMKAILDPAFMNYRANTYYDTLKVKNARAYFYQLAPSYAPVVPYYDDEPDYSFDITSNDVYLNVTTGDMTLTTYSLETLITQYVGGEAALAALKTIKDGANEYGYTLLTDENMDAAIDLIAYALMPFGLDWGSFDEQTQKELFMEALFRVDGYGTATSWDDVGCYAIPEENAVVILLDKAYSFLNKDGSLGVWSAYYMSSLPLVKKDLYESCVKDPAPGATLYTSVYNSSLATTASWGPYKLVEFKDGSHYRLEKNEYWYGWNMEEYKNQYNITAINCRKVAEWSTQWMGFLSGEYDDASLSTDNVAEYSTSKYVYYSTKSGTYGMQLYSNLEVLKNSDNNNAILAILEFRQAVNLALNRSDIVETIWPGSTVPCFGLVNTAYYYDVENGAFLEDGGIYRNNPIAQAGILRAYGWTETDGLWTISEDLANLTLEEAYECLTGYNLPLAKEKMKEAIAILNADPEYYGYDATKDITIIFGSSSDTDKQRFRCDYLQGVVNTLTEGTSLEGKIKLVFDASAGSQWAEAFRSGATQIGFGYGFSGNAFNPFDIIGAFTDPDDNLNYHMYWDTSAIDLTITLPAGEYEGAGQAHTMSVQNWFFCLNGLAADEGAPVQYNWDAGFAPAEARLTILSALEEVVIKESRSIMLIGDAGGSFLGAKFSYITNEYNTFMGFGGIRYIVVEYTDTEWSQFVKANNNDLSGEYMKSE